MSYFYYYIGPKKFTISYFKKKADEYNTRKLDELDM